MIVAGTKIRTGRTRCDSGIMDLPPLTHKEGRAHNHIDPDEYHSLFEWEEGYTEEDSDEQLIEDAADE